MKREYFVLARSLWQGDTWGVVASADNKDEAHKIAEEKAHNGWSDPVWDEERKAYWAPIQDLKRVINTRVVTKTEMIRQYKISVEEAREQIAYVQDSENIDWTI